MNRLLGFLFLLGLPSLAMAVNLGTDANYTGARDGGASPGTSSRFDQMTQGFGSVVNGAYQYNIPIYLPPTTNNIGPKLSYTYSSANPKDSHFGVGWTLAGIGSITRCQTSFATEGSQAQKPNPRYSLGDRLCLNGMKLVLKGGSKNASDTEYWQGGATYQTEADTFTKVVANSDHTQFKVYLKNGQIQYYGDSEGQNSTYYRPGFSSGTIKRWGLAKTEDRYGNSYRVYYDYDIANAEQVIKRIKIDPNVEVIFDYQQQFGEGIRFGYDMGHKYTFLKLLNGITVKKIDPLSNQLIANVRHYKFNYNNDANNYYNVGYTKRILLNSLSECGYASAESETMWCGLPLKFKWSKADTGFENTLSARGGASGVQRLDLDGNGYMDFVESVVVLNGETGELSRPFDGQLLRSRDPANTISSYPVRFKNGYGVVRITSTRTRSATGKLSAAATTKIELLKKVNGQSGFVTTTISPGYPTTVNPTALIADFNGDGLEDVCAGTYTRLQNPATGELDFNSAWSGCGGPPDLVALDINSDGLNDKTFVNLSVDSNVNPPKINSATLWASISLGDRFLPLQDYNQDFFWRPAVSLTEYAQHGIGFGYMTNPLSGSHRALIDLNGDGLLDVLYINSSKKITFRLNTGYGLSAETVTEFAVEYGQGFVVDYNKDGLQDYVHTWGTGAGDGDAKVRVYTASLVNGQVKLSYTTPAAAGLGILVNGSTGDTCSHSASTICEILALRWVAENKNLFNGDVNNDGYVDIVTWQGHYRAKRGQHDLLTSVTEGPGGGKTTTIYYSELVSENSNGQIFYTPTTATYPFAPVNRDKYVVQRVSTPNGVSGVNNQYFYYKGGKIDLTGRGFAGFESIRTVDSATGNSITTDYHQSYPLTGRIKSQVVKDETGNLLTERHSYYKTHPDNPAFSFENHRYEAAYEKTDYDSVMSTSSTEQRFEFDIFGNLTSHKTIRGRDYYSNGDGYYSVLQPQHELEVVNQYTNNDFDHLLGFLNNTRSNYRFSDGSESRTQCTSFTPQSNTLDIRSSFENCDWTPQNGTNFKYTVLERNNKGVITKIRELATDSVSGTSAERSETFEDFEHDIYPRRILNGLQHVTTVVYDQQHSSARQITDDNGFTVTKGYAFFGAEHYTKDHTTGNETILSFLPCNANGGTCSSQTNIRYSKREITRNPQILNGAAEPVTSTDYDILGREVRRASNIQSGGIVFIKTEYNKEGHVYRVSEPSADDTPDYWTQYTYDKKGRVISVSFPDGGSKTTSYRSENNELKIIETTRVVGVNGTQDQVKTTYHNSLGQVRQVVDAMGNRVDYGYDAQGNLKSTIVNGNPNTQVSIIYDVLGNKTQIIDPDSGKINFAYNGFGELRLQTWQKDTPNAKSIEFRYDLLGRKTQRIDRHPGRSDQQYIWEWDTQFLGALTASYSTGSNIGQFYNYNTKGQITGAGRERSGGWRFAYEYDVYGRISKITYPNNQLKVERRYNSVGVHVSTVDAQTQQTIWRRGDILDGRGSFTHQRYGNGVKTEHVYNPANGKIAEINAGKNTVADTQSHSYSFDTIGNLISHIGRRINSSGTTLATYSEPFGYDSLNRLVQEGTSSTAGSPCGQHFCYDGLGNITYKTGVGELKYDRINGAGVHAITQGGGRTYRYDAYGNMIQRGTQTVDYDVFNKPIRIGSSYFTYGADHELLSQSDNNFALNTYYLKGIHGEEFRVVYSGAQVKYQSYVDGVMVHEKDGSGNIQVSYLHYDHLGSVETITDANGNVKDHLSYDAWGERRQDNWGAGDPTMGTPFFYDTQKGFTGHEMLDHLGLIHMGGRVYDPLVSRFMSADIYVQAPYNSQSYNRYSYVFNNPLSFTDPTGYRTSEREYSTDITEVVVTGTRESGLTTEQMMYYQMIAQLQAGQNVYDMNVAGVNLRVTVSDPNAAMSFIAQQLNSTTAAQEELGFGAPELNGLQVAGPIPPGSTTDWKIKSAIARGDVRQLRTLKDSLESAGEISKAQSSLLQQAIINAETKFGMNANQISHAFRHTDKIGLDRTAVEAAIRSRLVTTNVNASLQTGQGANLTATVDGITLTFRVQRVDSTFVNVGRITPPR